MDDQRSIPQGADEDDRRRDVRLSGSTVPQLSARLLRGPEVRLVDISRRGALIETNTRLHPGRTLDLCFVTADAEVTLSGCVVRSTVSHVSGSQLKYRTALSFGEDNTLYSRLVEQHQSSEAPETTAGPDASSPDHAPLTLVASVQGTTTELRNLLAVNDW
jgi:hypothetical protein